MAIAIERCPDADLLYADEDRIGPDGLRCDPDFKPEWDPDLAQARDLIGPNGRVSPRTGREAGLPEAARPPDFARRCAAAAGLIRHVPAVLFHRTIARRDSPPCEREAAGARAHLRHGDHPDPRPRPAARALRGRAVAPDRLPELDIIIVDNDSRERRTARLLHRMRADRKGTRSAVSRTFQLVGDEQRGGSLVAAEIVLLLNNDIDVIAPGWLAEMVSSRRSARMSASVGAKLLYPDGSVQHAGIVLGPAGAAGASDAARGPRRSRLSGPVGAAPHRLGRHRRLHGACAGRCSWRWAGLEESD